MRITIILITCFFLIFSANSQTAINEDLFKFPLKSISTFCQYKPDSLLWKVILTYDKENRLEKSNFKTPFTSYEVVFSYNEFGLLDSKKYNYFDSNNPHEDNRIYKYDEKNNLIYEGFDNDQGNSKSYSYNNKGQLISSTDDCNYNHWKYSYEYDSKDKLSKKFFNYVLETSYEYSHNQLIKEIHYNRNGNDNIIYEYDENGLLINKKENEKVVEKNIYVNSRLIEQWIYYFGIDPGFLPCSSQYINKYEYY